MATIWDKVSARMRAERANPENDGLWKSAESARNGAETPDPEQLDAEALAIRAAKEAVERFKDTGIRALRLVAAGGLPQYCAERVTIKDKSGSIRPFVLNRAQMYVHGLAEQQILTRGYVRLIVLKGRQMGLSTYIVVRGYYKNTRRTGQQAYIMAHELKATANLFDMVKNVHDRMDQRLKPALGRSNANELIFPGLGGKYVVGTAKSGETGRSLTVQFFHGSECAFWQAAKQIIAGLLQTIGVMPGTEVWLESTANGVGNFFHGAVQAARKRSTDFELAFCPWYWDPLYETPAERVPESFGRTLTLEDREYMAVHALSMGQMHWRASKTAEFRMSEGSDESASAKFAQEYPATVEEAFTGDQEGSFIKAVPVMMARKAWREFVESNMGEKPRGLGPVRMGIDPSYTGGDGFRIWCRQGRVAWRAAAWSKKRTRESLSLILAACEKEQPDEIFIDVGNNGGPLYDLLVETPWASRVVPVLFGDDADEPERHQNKRCEMWYRMRMWLGERPQPMLEDMDEIQADLTGVLTRRDEVGNRTKLESKDDIRARLGKDSSPDDGDALGLTFAYPSGGPSSKGKSKAPNPKRDSYLGVGMSAR
jgi:hypothetical protein